MQHRTPSTLSSIDRILIRLQESLGGEFTRLELLKKAEKYTGAKHTCYFFENPYMQVPDGLEISHRAEGVFVNIDGQAHRILLTLNQDFISEVNKAADADRAAANRLSLEAHAPVVEARKELYCYKDQPDRLVDQDKTKVTLYRNKAYVVENGKTILVERKSPAPVAIDLTVEKVEEVVRTKPVKNNVTKAGPQYCLYGNPDEVIPRDLPHIKEGGSRYVMIDGKKLRIQQRNNALHMERLQQTANDSHGSFNQNKLAVIDTRSAPNEQKLQPNVEQVLTNQTLTQRAGFTPFNNMFGKISFFPKIVNGGSTPVRNDQSVVTTQVMERNVESAQKSVVTTNIQESVLLEKIGEDKVVKNKRPREVAEASKAKKPKSQVSLFTEINELESPFLIKDAQAHRTGELTNNLGKFYFSGTNKKVDIGQEIFEIGNFHCIKGANNENLYISRRQNSGVSEQSTGSYTSKLAKFYYSGSDKPVAPGQEVFKLGTFFAIKVDGELTLIKKTKSAKSIKAKPVTATSEEPQEYKSELQEVSLLDNTFPDVSFFNDAQDNGWMGDNTFGDSHSLCDLGLLSDDETNDLLSKPWDSDEENPFANFGKPSESGFFSEREKVNKRNHSEAQFEPETEFSLDSPLSNDLGQGF